MTATPVGDHEWLYRAIPSNGTGYRMTEEGLRISASAFADRHRRPSVDRSREAGVPVTLMRSPPRPCPRRRFAGYHYWGWARRG